MLAAPNRIDFVTFVCKFHKAPPTNGRIKAAPIADSSIFCSIFDRNLIKLNHNKSSPKMIFKIHYFVFNAGLSGVLV